MSAKTSPSFTPAFFESVPFDKSSPPHPPRLKTREEWLSVFIKCMRPVFKAAGAQLPKKIRVSCAFPVRTAKASGQILPPSLSADGIHEIFISPVLFKPLPVCVVVMHQLIHAALPEDAGYRTDFRRLAFKLGLVGKMTDPSAGDELRAWLENIIPVFLGPYPHSEVAYIDDGKKQSTRLVKLECSACSMIIRTTRQWLEYIGPPACACSGVFLLSP